MANDEIERRIQQESAFMERVMELDALRRPIGPLHSLIVDLDSLDLVLRALARVFAGDKVEIRSAQADAAAARAAAKPAAPAAAHDPAASAEPAGAAAAVLVVKQTPPRHGGHR